MKVETFDSLTEKQSTVSKEIAEAEQELKAAQDALANAKSLNKQVCYQSNVQCFV
jgi:hypothetical protein